VAAGFRGSCAIAGDGLSCWGDPGDQNFNWLAAKLVDLSGNQPKDVRVLWAHTCVLLGDGSAACAGSNTLLESGHQGPKDWTFHHVAIPQ
jgi:hypothetical protein